MVRQVKQLIGGFGENGEMLQELEQIVDMAKQADTPLLIDRTVRNTFLECAENYAGGDVSAQEAAQDMADKMELYLAE